MALRFTAAPIDGIWIVESDFRRDDRGSFGRLFSAAEFEQQGLEYRLTEVSLSCNTQAGTLRGMHYQRAPHAEAKLVRAVTGAVFDVVVDLRPGSATLGKWFGLELRAESHKALYVPRGFAHGFITLSPGTDVLYQITDTYEPSAATGFCWDDGEVAIPWPSHPAVVSESDRALPRFRERLA